MTKKRIKGRFSEEQMIAACMYLAHLCDDTDKMKLEVQATKNGRTDKCSLSKFLTLQGSSLWDHHEPGMNLNYDLIMEKKGDQIMVRSVGKPEGGGKNDDEN